MPKLRSLKCGWQKCIAPVLRPAKATDLVKQHVPRQILIDRPQSVSNPRSQARLAAKDCSGIHQVGRRRVIRTFAVHRTHLTQLVDVPGSVWQQFRNPLPRLPMLSPLPGPGHQLVLAVIEYAADLVWILFERFGNRLTMQPDQLGLVIQQVKGRWSSILKKEDDLFSLRSEMRKAFGQRLQRINHRPLDRRGP